MSGRFRHKGGGIYTLLKRRAAPYSAQAGERVPITVDGFLCFATATDDLIKGEEVVFYLGEDGRAWVRPARLFDEPERFAPLDEDGTTCP